MFKSGLGLCVFVLVLGFPGFAQSGSRDDSQAAGFAVVELFTSEGCSSCPAADRYLSLLTKRADAQSLPLFTLSFHVDYWDYLGWEDPYASKAYTQRQREYASHQRNNRIYTPQMMINGMWGFVGSDQDEGDRLVAKALSQKPETGFVIDLKTDWQGQKVMVDFAVEGQPTGYQLNLALVETGLSKKVLRGENRGRELVHDHVVRAFATKSLGRSGQGSAELEVPGDLDRSKARLIGYVQKKGPGEVVAAAMIGL